MGLCLGLCPENTHKVLAKIWVLHLAKTSKTNHRMLQKGMWPVGNIYICVIGVGPSYLIVKNGDIGNHGFSKLKVSSTLKYLSPLGQECNAFALLPFGILCCSFYPRKSHYRAINGPFWRLTLTLQKPRVLQMQDVKVEAVVVYADPLTTQQMRYHRLSRRVNNSANIISLLDFTMCAFVRGAR